MSSSPTSSTSIHNDVVPSEVGWQFVPQYYTFVNKQPDRLHCFYTKNSTFIHGTEGEDGKPAYGQQEIHSKIMSIGFQDCKVFIHSVDAQSSAAGGIIIQVIGEMSNKGEPWRKFAQTFFLAEQPNGYFVLNDIFRFLKEEGTEEEEEAASASDAGAPVVELEEPLSTFNPPEEVPELPVAEVEPTTVLPEPAPEPELKLNGIHTEAEPEPAVQLPPTPAPEPVESAPPTPPPPAPIPVPEEPAPVPSTPEPEPAPVPAAPTPPASTPAPASAPAVPTVPAAATPKTWASLAATGATKWGAAVSQEVRGTSEAAPPSPVTAAPVVNPAPVRGGAPPTGQRQQHPAYVAATGVTTPACFVKAVTENIPKDTLVSYLTQRFGPIKEIDIVRSKACAFLEFNTLDAARRAIVASLPQSQGGDGGVRIDVGEAQPARITIETRKERGERPPPRPRGGAPPNGDARGGFRGSRGGNTRGARGGRGGWE